MTGFSFFDGFFWTAVPSGFWWTNRLSSDESHYNVLELTRLTLGSCHFCLASSLFQRKGQGRPTLTNNFLSIVSFRQNCFLIVNCVLWIHKCSLTETEEKSLYRSGKKLLKVKQSKFGCIFLCSYRGNKSKCNL